jgi:uncharacterized cupredoxin-like copper-binding protein
MDRGTSRAGRGRHLRRLSRVAFALGVVLLFAGWLAHPGTPVPTVLGRAYAAASGGGGHTGSAVVNLTLNLTDAPSYTPADLLAPAGDTINLTLVNQGEIVHTFTLSNNANLVLNRSWTPGDLNSYLIKNGSQVNVSVAPGATVHTNVSSQSSQAGDSYEFFSAEPYQFQAGMFGFLNFTGAPTGPGVVANISTAATELAFVPDAVEINTSSFPVAIDLQISNLGSNSHTWWLEAQPNYSLNPGNFTDYFNAHPPLADVNVPTSPGAVVWANFTILHPGVYEYICTIPGHFSSGMNGSLYVGVPAPIPAAPLSTAIVMPWVLYGGFGLLGVGAVLAGAALLVGRSPPPTGPRHGH